MAALVGMVCISASVPVQVWFLTGGPTTGWAEADLVDLIVGGPLGALWQARMIGLGVILLWIIDSPLFRGLAALGAVAVCLSFSFSGHTMTAPRQLLALLLTIHMLAVAFWFAIFWPLHSLVGHHVEAGAHLAHAFGKIAAYAVLALLICGGVLFLYLAGSPPQAALTGYGEIFVFKLVGFALLLGLAAYNKLRLTPRVFAGHEEAAGDLQSSIAQEARVLVIILLLTAVATTVTSPG